MAKLMQRLMHRLLLRLPPERAHEVAMFFLKVWRRALPRVQGPMELPPPPPGQPPRLVIHAPREARLEFPARIGLAAGFDKNAEAFPALARLGFGFIEVGTVVPRPQPGNPRPRIFRVPPGAIVNSLGFNSLGLEVFARNLRRGRRQTAIPILANIGKNKATAPEQAVEDYRTLVLKLSTLVDGFVVNVSSPNTPGLRDLQSEEFLDSVASLFDGNLPVFVKLAPDLDDAVLQKLCAQVKGTGHFSGIVLTNTSVKLAKEVAGRDAGGLSGPPLFPRAIECVKLAREALGEGKTIIGVGGITNALDAQRMLAAGADLVEIYTSFIYRGPAVVREIRHAIG